MWSIESHSTQVYRTASLCQLVIVADLAYSIQQYRLYEGTYIHRTLSSVCVCPPAYPPQGTMENCSAKLSCLSACIQLSHSLKATSTHTYTHREHAHPHICAHTHTTYSLSVPLNTEDLLQSTRYTHMHAFNSPQRQSRS